MVPNAGYDALCHKHFSKSLLFVLSALVFSCLALSGFSGTACAEELLNSGWAVQGGTGSAGPRPAGQAQGHSEQLGDVQEEEPTFFDPEGVADSVPEGDWVFEIPVQVSGISPEVEKLGLVCEVFTGDLMVEEIYGENNWRNKVVYGRAKKRIDLHEGSFQGTVLVGVNKTGQYWKATHYTCWLYVIGPDNRWYVPTVEPKNPPFRRMHSGHPFQWETQGVSLPQWARFARPEGGGD